MDKRNLKTGVQLLTGATEDNYLPVLEYGSAIGVTRSEYQKLKDLARLANPDKIRLSYKDMPHWDLWFETLQHLSAEDAVAVWWKTATKDGNTLNDIISWATRHGFRPGIGAFGEIPARLLNNPVSMRKFADFELVRAYRIWQAGGEADLFKFSVGTLNNEIASYIAHALDVTRWDGDTPPIATLTIDEYAYGWPTAWMGPNQSDVVQDGASNDEKWAAILKTPYLDFSDPAAWRPAWLVGRIWGMENQDGSYGIHELQDCAIFVAELGFDFIDHPNLPRRGLFGMKGAYGGLHTLLPAWNKHLGLPPGPGLKAALEIFDDLYLRPTLPNGKRQVVGRMLFCGGPGYKGQWEGYDTFGSDTLVNAYHEYGKAHLELPPAWGTPEPLPEEPPIIVPPPAPEEPPIPTPDPTDDEWWLSKPAVWGAFFALIRVAVKATGRNPDPVMAAIWAALE